MQTKTRTAQALPKIDRDRLAALIEQRGERATAEVLAVARQTLGRALGGLPLQRATIVALHIALAKACAR